MLKFKFPPLDYDALLPKELNNNGDVIFSVR